MNTLQKIAARIERLEAARRLTPEGCRVFSDAERSVYYGDDVAWIAALEKNHIRFEGGPDEYPSFHYPDFTKIDFSSPEFANTEWRAQLNRFYWARPLTAEYLRTRDVKYARILRDTIEAWLDFHRGASYPPGSG
ncbi:MAG: hypothetical protein FWF84_01390, partial [Kiritimatiellaeota bacterium]|nr:hypothetical protein [Kiritimatiellota bacterium]